MDKETIINNLSDPYLSNKTEQLLAINLSKFYSELNNLELIHLNLLNIYNNNYWFICRKTAELFLFNLVIKDIMINEDQTHILSTINRTSFKQINFELDQIEQNDNKNNYIKVITFNSLYFGVKNINIENKTVNIKKRKLELNIDNKQNKKKKNDDIWKDMIAASSTRNYLLNDPLIDYLQKFNNNINISNNNKNITKNTQVDLFTNYIMNAGVEFEKELITLIKKNHTVVQAAESYEAKSVDKYQNTIDLMKKGVPIIYQAVLHNYDNKTYGVPDLLVRADYINKLMGYQVITNDEEKISSPLLKIKWHYKVIDIKHSVINLKANGTTILNSDSIPAYKGQLYIYTEALNKIQGVNINKAFIWGKKYQWESRGKKHEIRDLFSKLGIIDYDGDDNEYINLTNNAIEWLRLLNNEGHTWNVLPIPSRQELYPNMKNDKDGPWRKLKNEINEQLNDITSILYCGTKNRKIAHQNEIYSWNDPKCTAEIIGFNPKGKQTKLVNAILSINKQEQDIIRPEYINWDRANWYDKDDNCMEFYLDFETLNNLDSIIKDGIITNCNTSHIFMIGVGYSYNDIWQFKTFLIKNKSNECELEMFNDFYTYINNVLKTNNKNIAKFYHWSNAEITFYNSFKNKNPNINFNDQNYIFYDLYKIFVSEPISIKGALNYSLKTIGKILNKHGLIETTWEESKTCSNGLSAMVLANKIYEKRDCNINDPIMEEIKKYNQNDCKVLYEIHQLIRNK